MKVEILVIEGCPNASPARQAVERALDQAGAHAQIEEIVVWKDGHAGFAGSPTILINGRDVLPSENCCCTLSCRIYPNPENPGVPDLKTILQAIEQASAGEPQS